MNALNQPALDRVDQVAADVVAKHAVDVDAAGAFPEASMRALSEAGLLGLMSDHAVGGMGADLRTGVRMTERLARECGSTALGCARALRRP